MGLDFLTLACAPRQLAHMSPTNFESLRKLMNRSLDHVIGEAPPIMGGKVKFSQPPRTPRQHPRLRRQNPPLVSAISDPHSLVKMENVTEEEEERGEGGSEGEEDLRLESTPVRGQ